MLPRAPLVSKTSEFAGSLVSDRKWTRAPDLHWVRWLCRPPTRLFVLHAKNEKWFPRPVLPRHRLRHREECYCYTTKGMKVDPPVGFAPTWTCLQDRCLSRSATEEFIKSAVCRCCPGALCLEDRHAGCYIKTAEKVAGVGSAPTYAELQSAAHLSEPSSVKKRVVPPRGDAPRSSGYQPGALLLSYGGEGKVRRHGNAPCQRHSSWITVRFASLAIYRRVKYEIGYRDWSCTPQARLMKPGRALALPAFKMNGGPGR